MEWFQIVCPDEKVRHFPFVREGDAIRNATTCTKRGCRLEPALNSLEKQHPPCPGGAHTVRPCPSNQAATGS